jgi:putative addiction module component (TIGR02574 family)
MTTAHLEAEILKLPRSVRIQLTERLIASLDQDTEIDRAWELEADRRYQAYLKGDGNSTLAEDVMIAIRKEFNL